MNDIKFLFNKFKIYISNSAWVFSGLVLRTIIAIFIVSRIANQLGIADFGWYNYGISIFTILYSISTLGFGDTFLIKYFVNGTFKPNEIIGTSFISRSVCSLIILAVLSVWVFIYGNDYRYWVLAIASLAMLFQSSEVITAYFQWKLKAHVYIPINLIALIIESALLIYGLFQNYGLIYFISIYTLERVLILIGLLIYINKEIKISDFTFNPKLFKVILFQAWPLLMGAILTALYARFDQVLIKYFLSAKDLGIYGTGIILSQIWLVIPSLIIPILFPKIAELKTNIDLTRYYDLIYVLYGVLNYIAISIILFIFVFGRLIIESLYGMAYSDSVPILNVLIVNLVILFQSHLTSSVMIVENEEKYLFKIKLVSVIANVVLNIIFLSTMGVEFAAYSLLVTSILSWVIMAWFNKTMFELLKLNLKSFLLPLHLKRLLN